MAFLWESQIFIIFVNNKPINNKFMKRFLLLVATVSCLVCTGCSKDASSNDNKLDLIQIRVTSDDEQEPSGNVYLFYLNSSKIELDGAPHITYAYPANVPYLKYKGLQGDDEMMFPCSAYGKSSDGKLLSYGDGYSQHSIFWYELSTSYGTPLPGGRYVVCICLNGTTYARMYKEFTLTRNAIISVHAPTCKDTPAFVEAEWSISDL